MDETISEIEDVITKLTTGKTLFSFKLNELPEHNNYETSIRFYERFEKLFKELNNYTNDCIYWFSTNTKDDALLLKETLNSKRTILRQQKEDTRLLQ